MSPIIPILAVLLLLSAACARSSPPIDAPAPVAADVAAAPDHVVLVVFENKAPEQVLRRATYLRGLAGRSAWLTGSRGIAHPSQPNYFALFSGSTQGVTDDSCVRTLHGRANLRTQLVAGGHTFAAYSEGLPRTGYRGCHHGRYAAKHNPWVAFDTVPDAENKPFSAWPRDFRELPTVAFVVPDLCHDMHDCPIATGDRWARDHLDPYARWAATHNSLLVVTFDENDGRPGNRIFTVVSGAHVSPGRYSGEVTQYGMLRMLEGFYGLAPLGHAAGARQVDVR